MSKRVAVGRELLGGVDALVWFQKWVMPSEHAFTTACSR